MAKYNNEFLERYFRDIYALYALRRKINRQIEEDSDHVAKLRRGYISNPKPPLPTQYAPEGGAAYFFAFLFSLIALLSGAALVTWEEKRSGLQFVLFVFIISLLIIIWCVWYIISERKKTRELNKSIQAAYQAELEGYESRLKINDELREGIPLFEQGILFYQNEIKRIDRLIGKLYAVNILPSRYRDFYAVVYLYDYFSGSRETDLGMALNTYVLEQIKDRLDMLISQMSEVILNQYTIMDNQQAAMEQAERHHVELCRKLRQIEATNEERNVYLEMIKANTATMKYFATADYIREWRSR